MDAAERHVLDSVPVALQVWEAQGRSLSLRYANDEAGRSGLPTDPEPLLAACLAQEPMTLELDDGECCWRVHVTPLGGTSILSAFWDITAQKAHERSLRASEQLNREILSGLQEGVLVVDTDTRVVVANEAAAETVLRVAAFKPALSCSAMTRMAIFSPFVIPAEAGIQVLG